jgi:soluble lytic murein transglycosylase
VDFALSRGEPYVALTIAKRAADFGIVVPRGYYPVVDLGVTDPRVPMELALAIARRESEFVPTVTSPVGARGLMQVMPGTAQEVAGGSRSTSTAGGC